MAETILGYPLRWPRGSPCRAAQGQRLLPSQIWENICCDKASASWGRVRPRPISCSAGAGVPLAHPGQGRGQTLGLMGWKPMGTREGMPDGPSPKAPNMKCSELSHRPQDGPMTPQSHHGRSRQQGQHRLPPASQETPSQPKAAPGQAGSVSSKEAESISGGLGRTWHQPRALGPCTSVSRRRDGCPACCCRAPEEGALQALAGPQPTSYGDQPGSGGARWCEGDWAAAPARQRWRQAHPHAARSPAPGRPRLWPGATRGEPSRDMQTQAEAGSGPLSRPGGLKQHASVSGQP